MSDRTALERYPKIIDKVWEQLNKPKGLRFWILRKFFPEIVEIARILREEYYWYEE